MFVAKAHPNLSDSQPVVAILVVPPPVAVAEMQCLVLLDGDYFLVLEY